MKRLLILSSLFLIHVLAAQDAKEFLKRMNNAYASAKSTSMNFTVDYYASSSLKAPTTSTKGEVRFSGLNYYSDAMGEIVLVNKKYTILIDQAQHTITCLPGRDKHISEANTPSAVPDSSWLTNAHLKLLDQSGPSRRIEISGEDGVYEKTEIKINATTYAMEEITYYYSKLEDGSKPKLVVTYSSVRFENKLSDAGFSEKNYIRKTNGKFVPAPAWNNYQVIDLTKGSDSR